ncbi:hypothetical protein GOL41_26955 [Sinorhizobium medicae]|nr:hypothetical protein [Sinorhizobium meliloti]MDX0351613.1 hypothetical protein [Sinorhizobium meliloti]MDX0499559.1 hypothetical protein [Sinorhizobium medicae]MDX1053355.1 hypothetical protein [Sinorhizobium medicae]
MSEASDPYSTAKANLRDTIKWLATSLAAVGAAVIAGASINGLAALHGRPLILAALLGGAGLVAILVAIGILVRLLTSKVFYFSDLRDPNEPVTREINSRAEDILSPQTPTIADLVKFRQGAVDDLHKSKSGDPLYELAFRKWTAANDLIARVTNLGQFLAFRNEFERQQGKLFALTIVIILTLGGYALLAGTQSELTSSMALKIVFKPGPGWSDAAALLAKQCGGDPLDGTMLQKKPFDGWVSVRLAQPGRCGGLELSVPASLVHLSEP